MLFLVFFLLGFYASAAGSQDFGFVCGFEHRPSGVEGATGQSSPVNFSFYQSGTVRPLILFGKLNSPDDPFSLTQLKDRNGNVTQSSADLLNPDRVGSLAHYFKEMSYGALTLEDNDDSVERMWFEADSTKATDYDTACMPGVIDFAEEVFADADDTIDFSDYDRDGDGVVDLVILYIPIEFKALEGCGFEGTVIEDYASSQNVFIRYPTADSVSIEGRVLVVFQRPSFPYLVGVTAHEYGHMMDLPDLYDRQGGDAAGIGLWGVMGWGPVGWSWNYAEAKFSGPNPLSVWSRYKVGWITEANGRLETVEADTVDATLHDIHSQSSTVKAYKIPIRGSETEYFLMANRQNTYDGALSSVGYYDDLAPASGLAIWHIDDGLPIPSSGLLYDLRNSNEKHKRVDLECADGLYDNGGFGTAGNSKNSISGGDNLDYLSADTTYTKNYNGNIGDDTDLWDGSKFTPTSNPSTAGYNDQGTTVTTETMPNPYVDDTQDVFTGIAVQNISQTKGVVSFKVHFIPSAPGLAGTAHEGTTLVTLGWSVPKVNATAISEYQYSIDETNWTKIDGGASARFVSFDNATSTTFYVRAVTANEHGETAKIDLDRPGYITLTSSGTLAIPMVGDMLTATPADPNMSESDWDDDVSWQWQRKDVEDDTWDGTDIAEATRASYRLTLEDVGKQIRATVTYNDEVGSTADLAASDPTVAVVSSNRPPVLTGFAEASVSEGRIRVTTYRASDPDKDSLVWSLGGTDAAAFELFGSGQARTLRLQAAADFEQQASYSLTVGVSDGSRSSTLDVTVRVKNIEEAGRVALTSAQPQVGTPLTATLSDPDGSITGAVWQWQRRVDDTADWVDISAGVEGTSGVAELSSYTPLAGDVGFMLQATVRYRDGYTTRVKMAESAATEAVVGPPAALASLTAAPGDGQIVLGWQAPASDGGSPISGYEYRQSADGGTTWQPDWTAIQDSDAETTGHTVEDLTNDTQYTFAVRAVNAVGKGAAVRATATPVWSNQPPTLTGPEEATVAEHSTDAIGPYEADDPDDDALTWSLSGADASAFELTGTGLTRSLALKTPPDFEQQASYSVTVGVSDTEPLSATVTTTVSVSNVDEAGTVALTSTKPQVGTPLTATLSDPDGSITGATWQWQRRASSTADWADVPAGAEGASGVAELSNYTPQAGDVGLRLQATVRYRDGHSADATDTKTARSATTEGVVGPPAAVASLTAAPGDGQVALTWQAPASDGGSPITGYEYRQSTDGGTTWQPDWTAIADSDAQTTGHTVSGLTNGTAYTFAVRAVNTVGKGAARAVTATPVLSNQSPTLQGPATANVAEHSTDAIGPYEADDPDDDELTWTLGGADASAFELTGTGNTRSLAFQTPPDFEQQSSYAVSVSVDDGALSATVTTTISVANIDEAGTVALSSTAPQVGVPLTATLSDPDGGVTNLRWRWLSFRAGVTGQGEEVPAALGIADGQTATLTPTRALVETRIQARALYVV